MEINNLNAISPVDGKYWDKTKELSKYFSEYALIRSRVLVEVEYFISLCNLKLQQLRDIKLSDVFKLKQIYEKFTEEDALKIKELEKITNHDVKAVEYFIKNKFVELGYGKCQEFIHFGLTSQDINNTAIPLLLKNYITDVYLKEIIALKDKLFKMASAWKEIPMLAYTHGQPATPTVLGK